MIQFCLHRFCTPTNFANTVFHMANQLFKENRHLNLRKKNMDKELMEFIYGQLKSKYDLPKCGHTEDILRRFLRGKLHFFANQLNSYSLKMFKEEIEAGAASASKSTAHMQILQ